MSDHRTDPSNEPVQVERSEPRVQPTDATAASGGGRRIDRDPSSERIAPEAGAGPATGSGQDGLLTAEDRDGYQRRWDDIQVRFIDEPRQSAREADDLVSEVAQRIADRFSSQRQDLERRWESGDEPTTEELRQAVQRYRDFFQRLVTQ